MAQGRRWERRTGRERSPPPCTRAPHAPFGGERGAGRPAEGARAGRVSEARHPSRAGARAGRGGDRSARAGARGRRRGEREGRRVRAWGGERGEGAGCRWRAASPESGVGGGGGGAEPEPRPSPAAAALSTRPLVGVRHSGERKANTRAHTEGGRPQDPGPPRRREDGAAAAASPDQGRQGRRTGRSRPMTPKPPERLRPPVPGRARRPTPCSLTLTLQGGPRTEPEGTQKPSYP